MLTARSIDFMSCAGSASYELLGGEHDLGGVVPFTEHDLCASGVRTRDTTHTHMWALKGINWFTMNFVSRSCVFTSPSARCSSFTGRLPVILSSIQHHWCNLANGLSESNNTVWMLPRGSAGFKSVAYVDMNLPKGRHKMWSLTCVDMTLCVCDCGCRYMGSVSIHSLFDLRCVSPVYLGATWAALERGLSAEFPPQAKLVITFPGCHHFIAIHHDLELFGFRRNGDRHC